MAMRGYAWLCVSTRKELGVKLKSTGQVTHCRGIRNLQHRGRQCRQPRGFFLPINSCDRVRLDIHRHNSRVHHLVAHPEKCVYIYLYIYIPISMADIMRYTDQHEPTEIGSINPTWYCPKNDHHPPGIMVVS